MPPRTVWGRYGYTWVTAGFLIVTLIGHWLFGWFAFVEEQRSHGQPIEVGAYSIEMLRDTMENWQSEFLQLIWQVAGLSLLMHVGSPQSKEGEDRMEAKIDALVLTLQPEKGDRIIKQIDETYAGRNTDVGYEEKIAETAVRG
jgi:hypothetical protein